MMSEPVYAFADAALIELEHLREEITSYVRNRKPIPYGPLFMAPTAANASMVYQKRAAKILREGRVQVDSESTVDVQCSQCERVHRIKRIRIRFECQCSPKLIQYQFQRRVRYADRGY